MNDKKSIEILNRQIDLIKSVAKSGRYSQEFKKWHRDTEIAIQKIFGETTRHIADFNRTLYSLSGRERSAPDYIRTEKFQEGLKDVKAILESLIEEIENYGINRGENNLNDINYTGLVSKICNRFHKVARQIRSRHNNRETLSVEDEYDVQDLLHSLLVLEFDDISFYNQIHNGKGLSETKQY